jgi:nucleotide-binding universal stress UspA family protein
MFRILVPIDFTSCSKYAVKYAIKINQVLQAEITLLYAVHFPGGSISINVDKEIKQALINEAELELQDYVNDLKEKYDKALSVKYSLIYDSPALSVKRYLENNDVDLIIIGSKPGYDTETLFSGNHAPEIIEVSNVPVIIVPEGTPIEDIKSILYATDFDNIYDEMNELIPFAKIFNASISVVHIFTDNIRETNFNEDEIKNALKRKHNYGKISFTAHHDTDIISGIENEILKVHPNLVALFHKHKHLNDLFLDKSITKRISLSVKKPAIILKQT